VHHLFTGGQGCIASSRGKDAPPLNGTGLHRLHTGQGCTAVTRDQDAPPPHGPRAHRLLTGQWCTASSRGRAARQGEVCIASSSDPPDSNADPVPDPARSPNADPVPGFS
jgi:hypothetical protein